MSVSKHESLLLCRIVLCVFILMVLTNEFSVLIVASCCQEMVFERRKILRQKGNLTFVCGIKDYRDYGGPLNA